MQQTPGAAALRDRRRALSLLDDRGIALQIFATLPPALAPALLAAYVLRFHVPSPGPPAAGTG